MGCRFSRNSSDTEHELDLDELTRTRITDQPLSISDYRNRYDRINLTTSGSTVESLKSLNSTTGANEINIVEATTLTKNARSLVRRCDAPILQSTFFDRFTSDPKVSTIPDVQVLNVAFANKPLRQTESSSQADFFRMLDEKIAQGRDDDLCGSDIEK